eukprot:CAMPEP_0171644582 /NCGR_PEP_ID=MMETSP0990-20121206/33485_1 /TAXON_ID=483369 /ORGANISM="non described non described, Strain CCMP2098" /LENGTH=98 /DNA_ID=CAMNT_0012220719 /DNA_START=522 /DNA_END=818 /DNA_ORIENTATION=+
MSNPGPRVPSPRRPSSSLSALKLQGSQGAQRTIVVVVSVATQEPHRAQPRPHTHEPRKVAAAPALLLRRGTRGHSKHLRDEREPVIGLAASLVAISSF